MGRYLVVANQTASSPELLSKLRELAAEDAGAEFVLLVPATPVRHSLSGTVEGESIELARRAGEAARALWEQNGLKTNRIEVGDLVPPRAVEDDLREHPTHYEGIIVSTFPLGVSRWLKLDVPHQMQRRFDIPVIHVVAQPTGATSA